MCLNSKTVLISSAIVLVSAISSPQAYSQVQAASLLPTASQAATEFSAFKPKPSNQMRLDYEAWDRLLKEMVMYAGPSLRKRAKRPEPIVGTRFVYGHTSPYRLEGNKVVFEGMDKDFKNFISDYVTDLETIANDIDIAELPKNEQLAFWFNLHNAIVINSLAARYPSENTRRISGPDGLSFHDSKRVRINDIDLSLRDIRENIVYEYWSDPVVIYGFFLGELGSPSIQREAFTGKNLRTVLNRSADEFTNSLRGFEIYSGKASISQLYQDVAPFYFPNFDTDVRAHLNKYMKPSVSSELRSASGPLKLARYDSTIADMSAGDGDRKPISRVRSLDSNGLGGRFGVLSQAAEEYNEKFREIRQRGLFGTVIIEDIETVDPDAPPAEIE